MTTQNDRNRDRNARAAGNRQREREQQQTTPKTGTRPWGRASAVIENPGQQRAESKARFVPIGAVWETENGNLKLTIEATPQQWNDPHFRRVVVIVRNEGT